MRSTMFRSTINAPAAVAAITHLAGAAFLLATMPVSASDGSACYAIVSSDHRAFCLAKARKDPSMCYAIIDNSMRAACLAEVRREASH